MERVGEDRLDINTLSHSPISVMGFSSPGFNSRMREQLVQSRGVGGVVLVMRQQFNFI